MVRTLPTPSGRRTASILALLFAVTSVVSLAHPQAALAWDSLSFSSQSEKDLIALTNRSRAAAGLKALKVDSTLTSVARWRSKDMITRDYFSHDIPGYGSVFKKLDAKGYCYKVAGENIGWNNYPDDIATAAIHKMFMDSDGHRANIMGKAWDVVGIGAYKGPTGKKMWTVIFADRCGSTTTTKSTSKATPKPVVKAKATPKPTPKPTPVPTPVRTMTPEPTDPSGLGFGPGGRGYGVGNGADNGHGGASGNGPPPGQAGNGDTSGLRVVDSATPPGLVEAIVGDVTGFFFGG
ncbi:MAG TPA: CAP domain-containing protein [Candidatus Limnocylindrales bacterium]|nr:CAP domain-containing protein [Candidatus Limnocylindrales bacterium]